MRLRSTLSILLATLVLVAACASPAAPTPAPTKPAVPAAATPAPTAGPTAPPASSSGQSTTPVTLKYGTTQFGAEAGVYVALEKGYFKEQGINLEVVNFRTQQEMIAPLTTGDLDIGSTPLSLALLNAMDRGLDLKIVADMGQQIPGFYASYILVRKDLWDSGEVRKPTDLKKGMKIAIPGPASAGEMTVDLLLAQANLTREDVEVVVIPFTDQPAAFANKAIAASFSSEPSVTRAVEGGFAAKWMPAASFHSDRFQVSVILFPKKLTSDPDLGRRWMTAYLKGVRAYLDALTKNVGREEVISTLIKYTPAKDPKLYDQMQMTYLNPDGTLIRDSIEFQYKWFVDKGLYKGKKTFVELIDTSFAEYAANKLGKYQ